MTLSIVGACFSPVAGIQWVETATVSSATSLSLQVSVPLPGFSGLRPELDTPTTGLLARFSPVAGIQWVETSNQRGLPP